MLFFFYIHTVNRHSFVIFSYTKKTQKKRFLFISKCNSSIVFSNNSWWDFWIFQVQYSMSRQKNWKHWTSKVSNWHFWVFWLKVFSLCWLKLSFFRPAEKTTCFSWRRGRRARYGEGIVGDLQKVGVALDSWHAP